MGRTKAAKLRLTDGLLSEKKDQSCFKIEQSKLPKLIGDKKRLKQLLINLIKNAVKFTTKGLIKVCADYNYQK